MPFYPAADIAGDSRSISAVSTAFSEETRSYELYCSGPQAPSGAAYKNSTGIVVVIPFSS
jgi:hypothetical protein